MPKAEKDLDPLPKRKGDERIELKEQPTCNHFFVRTGNNEAECQECHMGYQMTPDSVIEGGHIYKKELVI